MSPPPKRPQWRKSSHSATSGQCVEVAQAEEGGRTARDSKHSDGPVLSFGAAAWSAFTAGLRPAG
jgi:hypothetical protein